MPNRPPGRTSPVLRRRCRRPAATRSGPGRRFYALHWPSAGDLLVLGSITVISILVFEAVLAILRRFDINLLEPEAEPRPQ